MKMFNLRISFVVIPFLLLVMITAGCAPAAAPTVATPAMESPTQPAMQSTQSGVPVTGSQTINVNETEFKLDMPGTVKAGMVTFNVTNKGAIPHSLEIQGQGIDQKLPSTLQPGQSGSLQVDLKPGTYMVFCPVDDHKGAGMMVNLTVQ